MAALGGALGATVGLFSVLNAVLLADPPFREAGRVVFLRHSYTGFVAAASVPTFLDYRRQTRAFEALSAAVPWEANLAGDGEAERVHGLQVTAEFFAMLGVAAFRGRTFLAGEDQPGREHVVVVSHGLWQRRFGRDPTLVGRTLRLNDEPYEVVGILPPGFAWGRVSGAEAERDVWAPYALTPERRSEESRGNEQLDVYGRLRPGVRLEQAQAELDAVIRRLLARFAGRYTEASGFLARAATRRRETSVRVVLGASRLHLLRQILAESSVLAAVAGGIGVLLAHLVCRALEGIDRVSLPRLQPVAVDANVLAFALLATLAVALTTGPSECWSRRSASRRIATRTGVDE